MEILENNLTMALVVIHQHLQKLGIETVQRHNFKRFKKITRTLTGRKCSGQFDPKRTLLHKDNAFWLEWRVGKRTICVHAMRFDDYGGTSLASVWKSGQQQLVYKGGVLGSNQPKLAKRMNGKIAYGGDLFLIPEFRGEKALSTCIALQSFFYAEIKWKPDWIYGFIDKRNMTEKGFAARFGYNHKAPIGTHWKKPPKGIRSEDYIAALDRSGLARNAWVIAESGLEGLLHMQ